MPALGNPLDEPSTLLVCMCYCGYFKLMATTSATSQLPPVKSVVVYRNGDPFYSGRKFVVNQRQIATMDALLNDITQSIGAPLAVRTLYTPRCGHRVTDLTDLQQGAQYVAAGFERFKKLDYLSAGLKKSPMCRTAESQVKGLVWPVSAKWRNVVTLPCIIYIYRNGDILSPAMRLIIPRHMQKNLEQILSLISEKAMLRTGAVRRLCTLEGFKVTTPGELESGQHYVAVGSERFKKLPYVEIQLNKANGRSVDRHIAWDRGLQRRTGQENRRVRSTGDEAERESERRTGRGEREDHSVFHARPVQVDQSTTTHHKVVLKTMLDEPSLFRASENILREEVRGAEEVAEDENTTMELPVDQREAEIVDEELNETDHNDIANTKHNHSHEARIENGDVEFPGSDRTWEDMTDLKRETEQLYMSSEAPQRSKTHAQQERNDISNHIDKELG